MIFRSIHNRENPYFQMRRDTAQEAPISYEAIGVLSYLLSKPDGWRCTIEDLIRRGNLGCEPKKKRIARDKTYRIVQELRNAGYIVQRREQNEHGRFLWINDIHETPQPLPENTEMAQPVPALPYMAPPEAAQPHAANPRHVNIEEETTEGETTKKETIPSASPSAQPARDSSTKEATPSKTRKRQPKEPISKYHSHPAVTSYREILGFRAVNAGQAELIAVAVGADLAASPRQWVEFLTEHANRGAKWAHNVPLLVDAFARFRAGALYQAAIEQAWNQEKGRNNSTGGNGHGANADQRRSGKTTEDYGIRDCKLVIGGR